MQDVGFILPSDVIDFVMRQDKSVADSSFFSNGAEEVLNFWLNEQPHHIDRLGLQEAELSLTLPICWHEDAVPQPEADHEGKPLTGKRLGLASTALADGWKGKFCFWKGDAEARWHAHDTGHDLFRMNPSSFLISTYMTQVVLDDLFHG